MRENAIILFFVNFSLWKIIDKTIGTANEYDNILYDIDNGHNE